MGDDKRTTTRVIAVITFVLGLAFLGHLDASTTRTLLPYVIGMVVDGLVIATSIYVALWRTSPEHWRSRAREIHGEPCDMDTMSRHQEAFDALRSIHEQHRPNH